MLSSLLWLFLLSLFVNFNAERMQKIAVVTGSNQGIGKEIAKELSSVGCKTILACRNLEAAKSAATEIGGDNVDIRQLDISSKESIDSFTESLMKDYPCVDILVNNAAMAFKGSDPTPFDRQARPTISINYFGTLWLTEKMMPLLKKSSSGRIVNVASQAGLLRIMKSQEKKAEFTSPSLTIDRLNELMNEFIEDVEAKTHASKGWPGTTYGMSKLGVIALTKILARENPKMLINCCCPGYCATGMSSYGGHGSKEAADKVGFRDAGTGAKTPVMLSLLPDESVETGKFFLDNREIEW